MQMYCDHGYPLLVESHKAQCLFSIFIPPGSVQDRESFRLFLMHIFYVYKSNQRHQYSKNCIKTCMCVYTWLSVSLQHRELLNEGGVNFPKRSSLQFYSDTLEV